MYAIILAPNRDSGVGRRRPPNGFERTIRRQPRRTDTRVCQGSSEVAVLSRLKLVVAFLILVTGAFEFSGSVRAAENYKDVEDRDAFVAETVAKINPDDFIGTYLVLVNANNRYSADDVEMMAQIRRLYLKSESTWPNARQSIPFARPGGIPADRAFRALVLGMDGDDLDAHWRRLKRTSGTGQPETIVDVRDLMVAIARNPGAFGVIAKWETEKLPAKVRILFKFSTRELAGGATISIERLFWESIVDTSDALNFQTYLSKFPAGEFAALARARLTATEEARPGEAAMVETAAVAPPEEAVRITEKDILEDDQLREAIRDYYNRNQIGFRGYREFSHFFSIEIINISGNRIELDIRYRVRSEFRGRSARAIVTVEKIGSSYGVLSFETAGTMYVASVGDAFDTDALENDEALKRAVTDYFNKRRIHASDFVRMAGMGSSEVEIVDPNEAKRVVEIFELLVDSFLGRFTRVDRASRLSLAGRGVVLHPSFSPLVSPENRLPFQCAPVIALATALRDR